MKIMLLYNTLLTESCNNWYKRRQHKTILFENTKITFYNEDTDRSFSEKQESARIYFVVNTRKATVWNIQNG